jgi:Sec-independent protein secretion pathway component TatC
MVLALFSISSTNFLLRWLAPRYAALVLSVPGVLYFGWHFVVEGLEIGWVRAGVWLLIPAVIITFSSAFAYFVSRAMASAATSASQDA